jgi:hypothetical protein
VSSASLSVASDGREKITKTISGSIVSNCQKLARMELSWVVNRDIPDRSRRAEGGENQKVTRGTGEEEFGAVQRDAKS